MTIIEVGENMDHDLPPIGPVGTITGVLSTSGILKGSSEEQKLQNKKHSIYKM